MFDPLSTTISEGVIAARLLLAVGRGAVIGFERFADSKEAQPPDTT